MLPEISELECSADDSQQSVNNSIAAMQRNIRGHLDDPRVVSTQHRASAAAAASAATAAAAALATMQPSGSSVPLGRHQSADSVLQGGGDSLLVRQLGRAATATGGEPLRGRGAARRGQGQPPEPLGARSSDSVLGGGTTTTLMGGLKAAGTGDQARARRAALGRPRRTAQEEYTEHAEGSDEALMEAQADSSSSSEEWAAPEQPLALMKTWAREVAHFNYALFCHSLSQPRASISFFLLLVCLLFLISKRS